MKNIKQILAIIFLVLLSSCNKKETNTDTAETLQDQTPEIVLEDTKTKFSISQEKSLESAPQTDTKAAKSEKSVNEELPKVFTSRKVISGGAVITYDINLLPGNIVRKSENDSTYIVVTAKSILKNSAQPTVESLQDESLYSNKITNTASFNGSVLIGGLKAEKDQLMELTIQDISKSIAPDSSIDVNAIKKLISKIPADKRKNYFFVKSSLLTFAIYRKYNKSKFNAKVNASYVTAETEVYSSRDKFSKERIVSLDLIAIEDMLDLIN